MSTPPTSREGLYTCNRCSGVFPKDGMSKNGNERLRHCRDCKNKMLRESYVRNRISTMARKKAYKASPSGRLVSRKANRKAYLTQPEKSIARSRLKYAVKVGKIIKLPCIECSEVKVEAHHFLGYAQEHWYDIKWLCRKHHRDEHKFSLESRGII